MAFDELNLEGALQLGVRNLRENQGFQRAQSHVTWDAVTCTLPERMEISRTLFGGSVARSTWGAPRPELDLFVVFEDTHRGYLASSPTVIFEEIAVALQHTHSFKRKNGCGRIAVREAVLKGDGFDRLDDIVVVPAFEASRGIMIPDRSRDEWICIDPGGFDELAHAAHACLANWQELTRILKTWNNRGGLFEPYIQPALLIELMVLTFAQDVRAAPDLGTQLAALFQLMFRRLDQQWPDPAGLGPPLGSYMTRSGRNFSKQVLENAWLTLSAAKRLDDGGNLREAKLKARSVLGKLVAIEPRYEDGSIIPPERLRVPEVWTPERVF